MNAKQYLDQAYKLNERIEDKQQRILKLKELAASLSGIDYSKEKVQTSHANDAGFEDLIAEAVMIENELKKDIADMLQLQCEINGAVDKVPDVNCSLVLSKRYLLMKTWEQIADEMDYCVAQVYRIHKKGLDIFVVPNSKT